MATTIFPRLRKAVSAKKHSFNLPHDRPTLLSSLPKLLKSLQDLSASESAASIDSELRNDHQSKKTLLYVLRKPEFLISRETLVTGNSTTAEILPGGGLRIDATNEETWEIIVNTFLQMEYYIPEDGKSATMVAADWSYEQPHVASMFLSLGTCLLKRGRLADRISAALAGYSDEPREIDDGWVHDLAGPPETKRERPASAA
jgi:hypothetical protein